MGGEKRKRCPSPMLTEAGRLWQWQAAFTPTPGRGLPIAQAVSGKTAEMRV
jgi:hypothetical protein